MFTLPGNIKVLNLPEQVGKNAKDIANLNQKSEYTDTNITNLQSQTASNATKISNLDTKTHNITGFDTGTSMIGTLDVEGKLTAGSDMEVDGKFKVNEFSDIIDKDNNALDGTFANLKKKNTFTKEQTFINPSQTSEYASIHSHPYGGISLALTTPYINTYYGATNIERGNTYFNLPLKDVTGYGGELAIKEDIPTYYQHTIRLDTTSSQSDIVLHGTANVIAKSNTPINSIQDLTAKLGNTDVMFSGITHNPGGTCLLAYIHIGNTAADCHVYSYNLETYSLVDFKTSGVDFTVTDSVVSI